MIQTLRRFALYHLRQVHPDHVLYAVTLVAGATAVLALVIELTDIRQVSIGYVIPVLIAAIRWGVLEATVAAIMAVAASAFFFYAPIYDFRVHDPLQIIDLVLFLFVAVVTGHFATRLRVEAARANRRERENGALYALARRLAAAKDAPDIYNAIQQHLALLVGRGVVLFGPAITTSDAVARCARAHVPPPVQEAILAALASNIASTSDSILEDELGQTWLVRAVSPQNADFGLVAINLGRRGRAEVDAVRAEIDFALIDATATLKRLELGRAIHDARSRSEAERLRDALLDSVSHELRTPLASVLGAASTLAASPVVRSDPRLSSLAHVVREEAERLNHDIQNLLDATRISSDGIHPKFEWSEPTDIVNAALERQQTRLNGRTVNLRLAPDLPLVYVDSVLVGQALGQVIDNAGKYSSADTPIEIEAQRMRDAVVISVTDRGSGFSPAEHSRAGERFFRGERHASSISGTGLGLWIAKSFVSANAGQLEITSAGAGSGTCVSIRLPVAREADEAQKVDAWGVSEG